MTTSESDPLARALTDHIWYTTTVRNGKGPFVVCKCFAQLKDSVEHSEHIARIARNFMASE